MTETYQLIDGKPTIAKDPNATLDYSIDLSAWLALVPGDTLVSAVWTVSSSLTKVSSSNTSTVAVVWLAGGRRTALEQATCQFTTTQGRVDERTIYLLINDR